MGDVVFFADMGIARRLLDLGVAQNPTYAAIEAMVLSKQKQTYENKQVIQSPNNKQASSPKAKKRGRPRKPK